MNEIETTQPDGQQAAAPARAGRAEWLGLAALVLPSLLVAIDGTALYYALPFISADLEPTSDQMLWIMDSYGFVLAVCSSRWACSATGSAAAGCCWSARQPSAPPR
jgi:DHA2 family multidrug resistance protein-like MFS transporter